MEKELFKQFRLGVFVVSGILLLILSMYLIGRDQHLFGSTIRLVTYFTNVSGLQPGNNVRFSGSDAGTVESVEVTNDTSVCVVIMLDEKFGKFIKQDAVATIGTDGLMGNKLINIINIPNSTAKNVQDGNLILTQKPVETDEMLRTLNQTNKYVSDIALNLKNVTDEIGSSRGAVWKLLTDTSLALHIDAVFYNLDRSSRNLNNLSHTLDNAAQKINHGDGLLGTLIMDTLLAGQLQNAVNALSETGRQSAQVSGELLKFTNDIDKGRGTIGMLLRDSGAANDLRTSIAFLRKSAENLNQSLEAAKKIPVLKKYLEEGKKNEKKPGTRNN